MLGVRSIGLRRVTTLLTLGIVLMSLGALLLLGLVVWKLRSWRDRRWVATAWLDGVLEDCRADAVRKRAVDRLAAEHGRQG